jgi:hypothetical protein
VTRKKKTEKKGLNHEKGESLKDDQAWIIPTLCLKSDKRHMNAKQSKIAMVQLQPRPNTTGQKDTSSAFVLIFLSQSGVVIGTTKIDSSPSSKLLAV